MARMVGKGWDLPRFERGSGTFFRHCTKILGKAGAESAETTDDGLVAGIVGLKIADADIVTSMSSKEKRKKHLSDLEYDGKSPLDRKIRETWERTGNLSSSGTSSIDMRSFNWYLLFIAGGTFQPNQQRPIVVTAAVAGQA